MTCIDQQEGNVKVFNIATLATMAAIGMGLAAGQAAAQQSQGSIQIVTAVYGKENGVRALNFTTRLQQTCGGAAATCEAFCSDSFLGKPAEGLHFPFTFHPICRVVYRCGSETTRTAEAERNETIDLDCRRPE
jgi:hypothetical protein